MDKKVFLKTVLNEFFNELNFNKPRYSEVWLSEIITFGFSLERYRLHVRIIAEPDREKDERMFLFNLIRNKLPEAYKKILSVIILLPNEHGHCRPDDVLVLRTDPVYQ